MNHDDQQENADIAKRLQQLYDRLLDDVRTAQAAHPDCPPVPRIMRGWLLPHEKTHVAQCPYCSQVTVKKPIFTPRFVWAGVAAVAAALLLYVLLAKAQVPLYANRWKTYTPNHESVGQLSLLGTVGEARMAGLSGQRAKLGGRIGPNLTPDFDDQRLALAHTVSPGMLSRLERVRLDLSKDMDPGTLEKLGADDGQLAQVVSPTALLALEKMDERTAASSSAAELLQFSFLRLRTAHIASPTQLLRSERLKAQLLTKLPAAVVLDLTETNLHTAEICGPAVLVFLFAREVDSADRVDSTVLLELAHRYSEMATKTKISRRRLRTIATHDYELALAQKSTKGAVLAGR
jgi:hypothetical protein